jgi:four helix bundle protein
MSESIKSYRDLIAWQKAFRLGVSMHRLASTLPDSERFGLIAQLRRSGTDAATNIAQGYGRGNRQDYLWFLKSARGDLYKLDTLMLYAVEFEYLPEPSYERFKAELEECEMVLAGLIRSLGG